MNKRKKMGYRTKKSKNKINIPELVITIAILILVCINLVIVMRKMLIPKANQQKQVEQSQKVKEEKQEQESKQSNVSSEEYQLEQLKNGTERDRIEYYCGQFLGYIEDRNYEKAYELLYSEFKKQYFPTIEDFIKYVEKTYPKLLVINYDDFDRQGDIYITNVIVDDAMAKDQKKKFTQRIVVKESDYNKYVLSFQVI